MSRQRTACPGCRKEGGDRSGDNLILFDDDPSRGYCYVCTRSYSADGNEGDGKVRNTRGKRQYQQEADPSTELLSIGSLPIRELQHKPVRKEVCEKYGVRVAVSEEDGNTQTTVYYPYRDQDENVVGYKARRLPKQFVAVGKIRGLFGQYQCKKNAKFLVIVEGEDDVLAAHQMLADKGKGYNVVSIPNGANTEGVIDPTTRAELEFITSHESVAICFDNDKAGQATAKALAELIVSQCKVGIVSLPRKDAGQMLIEGMAGQFLDALFGVKPYSPESVENGRVEDISEVLTPIHPGVMLTCLPKTSKKLYGLRPGEMTVLLAPPGVGKSTTCGQIAYELLLKQSEPVFGMFLEENKKKTRQRILSLHAGVALNRFRRSPEDADIEKVKWANDNLLSKFEILSNNKSLTTDDSLLNRIDWFAKVKGCRYGILDHLSFIIAARSTTNERKDIDELLTKLAQRVEDLQIHLILVSHIKRANREKERNGDKKYPYWEPLELDAARGSGAFEQLAHNIVAIERQIVDPSNEDPSPLTRTRILKNREEGTLGVGDTLRYDRVLGTPVPLEGGY